MQNVKAKAYTPCELEIIMLGSNDILTSSGGNDYGNTSGPADDPNTDYDW